jgi:hypothetical protein
VDWNWKPSVSTPFVRRLFGNEAAREIDETRALAAQLRSRPNRYEPDDIAVGVYGFFGHAPPAILPALSKTLDRVIRGEHYLFEFPDADPARMTLKEFADYRNFLRHQQYSFDNHEQIMELLHQCLVRIFCAIADVLPQTEDPSPFTIPLIYTLPNPGMMITQLYNTLVEDEYCDRLILRGLTERLYFNLCDASGIVPHTEIKKPVKHAADSDLPLDRMNDQYLSGTPFYELMQTPVPLKFTYADRYNHMHVLGGTGAGKTTLLKNLILHDLRAETPPALVVIDSQGDLIRELSRLRLFAGPLAERFVLITPKDIEHPPALNIFDVNRARLGNYDQLTKEQVIAGVIQTFDYLFSGLLGADLTAKQGVFFKYVARLMLSVRDTMGRNATILDMLALMENPAPYAAAIRALPPLQRNFFERDFSSKTFAQTKEQIRYRLQAIIENPTLARLFTSPETRIDLFSELNSGSIILVDTARDFLKGASSHFGRIFIALVLQAVLERAAIPEEERTPAFLIVDEAASYFDSNIDDLLTEARKYRLGCVFAHQYMEQAAASLRASLAANTGIKFAAGLSMADARHMAPDMRSTAEFILAQPRLHFAAHIRNVTPQAVSIPVEMGKLETEPRLSPQEYERLIWKNRSRVSLGDDQGSAEDSDSSMTDTAGSIEQERAPEGLRTDQDTSAAEW